MRTRSQLVTAAVTCCVLTAGCGGTTIDPRRAERSIAADYEAQVDGAEVTSVRCPDAIDPEPGTEVRCTMTLADRSSGALAVRVLDDEGRLRWDVEAAD
ncbi:MAG: DUF4333 domain-containing protein [Nocardioidaceae bacterium]|nr:DUF4333 domain-containing protein [Nocardioidaceae bacterium]